MIDRNVVSEITPVELQAWKGPVNWNTHHDMLKDSATNPARLVSNSSFTNGSTTLNDLLVKGPNTLNCLFTNLVRFRGYEIALVGDIYKHFYVTVSRQEKSKDMSEDTGLDFQKMNHGKSMGQNVLCLEIGQLQA